MKKISTNLLRISIVGIGAAMLALYVFALPWFAQRSATVDHLAFWRYPAMVGWYATAIPFYLALYHTMKLLGYIDKKTAFSSLSVAALRNVRNCAFVFSALFALGLPSIYLIADFDDAPGLMLLGLMIAAVPIVIATFAAVLQSLLQEAIEIKKENDLTV